MLDSTLNQYRILDRIGEGGMGVVYLAEDTRLKRKVALKFITSSSLDATQETARFQREAQAAARLNHPNICTVYELGEAGGKTYIAMEYIEGLTLKERMGQEPVSMAEIRDWLTQIAEGLLAAHKQGVIHRDVKPANIMITDEGRIKIMDFGIAKLAGAETELTQANSTIGTIAYMSPEQARGEEINQRTDIWALGVILYELVTGKRPFEGAFREAVMYAMMHTDPASPSAVNPEVPSDLEGIIEGCLKREIEGRYGSLEEVLGELKGGGIPLADPSTRPAGSLGMGGATGKDAASLVRPPHAGLRTPDVKRRWLAAAGVAAFLALLLIPSFRARVAGEGLPTAMHLAVLPFDTISGTEEDRAFSTGLAHLVATNLMRMEHDKEELWIIPVREVLSQNVRSTSDAEKAFGINLAVSGTIFSIDDGVQITLDLTDAKTLRVVQSATIELATMDPKAVQAEVMEKLGVMLGMQAPAGLENPMLAGLTEDPEAYKLYIQGQGFMQRYEDLDNINEAIRLFEKAIETDSTYALAYAGAAFAYSRRYGFIKEIDLMTRAQQRSEKAIKLNDQLPEVWVATARIHFDRRNYEEAIAASLKAVELNPKSYDANRLLAVSYGSSGQYDEAERYFDMAIALQPNYWDGYNARAIMYSWHMKEPARAIPLYEKVIELIPDHAWGYNNMGTAYLRLSDTLNAEKYYLQAVKIQPIFNAYYSLGYIALSRRAFRAYIDYMSKAIELSSEQELLWVVLGNAYSLVNEMDSARTAWQKGIELAEERLEKVNTNEDETIAVLAEGYARLGQFEVAQQYLERYAGLAMPGEYVYTKLARLYEYANNREKALEYLALALGEGLNPQELKLYPWLDDLRADPAYVDLTGR